jgi:uncharacterized repeat protein (TIGR03943 family)
VTGFVYRREEDPSGHFMVARFLMTCCSADAYAIALPVQWAAAEGLTADTWVRVVGTVRVGRFRDNTLPILQAMEVHIEDRPRQTYLYQ